MEGAIKQPPHGIRRARGARRAFTLIEASLVTVIVGVGVVAMLQLLAAGTASNAVGTETTTAVNLANNVHEICYGMAFYDPQQPAQWSTKEAGGVANYDNILDLDGETFSPPLDVRRLPMAGYGNWSQQVAVRTVGQDYVSSTRPSTTAEPTARVTVTVLHNGRQVYETSWLAVAPSPAN